MQWNITYPQKEENLTAFYNMDGTRGD